MKKAFLFFILISSFMLTAQRPIITKWDTSLQNDDFHSTITIYTDGSYNYTYVKADDASVSGTGTGGYGFPINFPVKGIYIVSIYPTGTFKFDLKYATVSNNNKFIELSQWGDVNWNTDLSQMFSICLNLQITATDIPDFSNVTNMYNMFTNCRALTTIPNINSWNVSKVTNMSGMFSLSNFNQNLENWDVSKVTDMRCMFCYAPRFNQNLGNWRLNSDVNLEYMFDDSRMLCENYSKTLYGWAENSDTPNGRTLGASSRIYGASGQVYRNKLINEKGWTILGDNFNESCVVQLAASENRNDNFAIYPNPVKDMLYFSEEVSNVKITDISGRTVKEISAKEKSVNVANLAKGVYVVSGVAKSGETINKKIIKE